MKTEPVLVLLNGLGAVVSLILGALVVLGAIGWDGAQITAVVVAITAVAALTSAVIRASVVSPDTLERMLADLPTAKLTAAPLDVPTLATEVVRQIEVNQKTSLPGRG